MDKLFKQALINNDLNLMKKVHKSDVHNHAGLGMRFSVFNKWVGGKVTPPPKKMDGISGLDNYISKETMKYVDSQKGFKFLIESTIEEAINDGVTLIEPSVDCCNIIYFENPKLFFDYIKGLVDKYFDRIDFRPEIGVFRGLPVDYWEKCVVPCIESGVFKSIDLYGTEEINNLMLYKKYYNYAKEKKLKTKIHVGEFCDSQLIIETIETLNPSEIQHGINSFNNPKAIEMIKERNIKLNICPTSNVNLGAVKSIETHPIKELFNKGIKTTINTDDLLLFDRSVSEEFLYVYNAGLLGIDELNEIRLNGLE